MAPWIVQTSVMSVYVRMRRKSVEKWSNTTLMLQKGNEITSEAMNIERVIFCLLLPGTPTPTNKNLGILLLLCPTKYYALTKLHSSSHHTLYSTKGQKRS